MAWGTPASRGTAANTAAPTSLPITATVAQGSLIFVAGGLAKDTPTVAVTDSVGNSYTVIQILDTAPATDITGFLAYAVATTALVAGTVTVGWGGGAAGSALAEVFEVVGGTVNDAAVTTSANEAATTTPTTTSGTPAEAGELFVAVDITQNSITNWTEDTGNGWSTLEAKVLVITAPAMALGVSYLVNAGVGAKTWAPTTGNVAHNKIIAGFKVLASNFTASNTLDAVTAAAAMSAASGFDGSVSLADVTLSATYELGGARDPGTQSFLKAREWPYRAVRTPHGGRRR